MESEIRRPIAKGARRCAFTGYRPMKMPFGYDEECQQALDFKHRLHDTIEMLILQGYKHMISGGAQGMDIMAAEAVLDLQKEYPEVTLEIAVPFEAQAAKWAVDYRTRWQECIDRADVVTVLSHEYTKSCLFARNRYLVTQADILLACFDGKEGGTMNTVEYAQRNGCRVCLIPPVKKECRYKEHNGCRHAI